jgi:hypothetical protein
VLSIDVQGTRLVFEHSLVSLSKWESIYEKPFFSWNEEETKTNEEMFVYFEQMLVSPAHAVDLIPKLTPDQQMELVKYINSSSTATVVRDINKKPGPKENVTSELIYYWMLSFKIPFEAESWHLNRLMTLIRICGVKNTKPQKQPASTTAATFRELNEARKKKLGTSG